MESLSVPKLASRARRYRSSTSASNPPAVTKAAEVLQHLFDDIARAIQPREGRDCPDFPPILKSARQIHQHVAASNPPSPSQDDFRHLNGYQRLLDVLRAYSGFYNPQKRSLEEKKGFFELLHIVLAIFSASFREHHGNRRYFKHRVEGAGWDALEQIIASVGLGGSDSDLWSNCQLFGKLLSFALDDQRLDELCQATAAAAAPAPHAQNSGVGKDEDDAIYRNEDGTKVQDLDVKAVETELAKIITATTVISNPEILRATADFWESMPREANASENLASVVVLNTLKLASSNSLYNLTALHGTGVLSRFLALYFSDESVLSQYEKQIVLDLCRSLMHLGVNRLADTQLLLSRQDAAASQFCLEMAQRNNGPPFVQFDLSLHGHSSIELASLGRSFPPQSSAGYTFTAWIRVDRFDPASHTTIFGVFDATSTCFLMAYLEKDTHNFILQTSVTSQRPSVRFKTVKFKEHRWYHIAIVHRRPRTMTASKASLYVNGEFAEQLKSQYPMPPPFSNASTESFASFSSSNNRTQPVQAFLGTPRNLSTTVGRGLVFSKWSLASAHLLEDALSDDFLAVHYRLGPRYQGNFQDCLGGFQTYEASAALGLRNEMLHPGNEENSSDILKAIRDKASSILPEQKILMSTLPTAVFRTDGQFLDSFLFRSLSRNAASNLFQMTTKSGTAISVNAALPCVNDALVRVHGVAVLTGDPVVATPYNFDANLWRVGGFTPVALKLVERTKNAEEFLRSVELMFLAIKKSWRNSEAMERDNGYAILAMLLRAKLGYSASGTDVPSWRLLLAPDERDKLSFQLLSLVLDFIGYKHAEPLESFIINPLAYRILLIDFDTWRKAASITQELYYKQFVTFAVNSKFHEFNSRRLQRMRIVKRLLDALKAETMSEDVLPHFLAAFESLIRCNFSTEVHRTIALFITYTFHSSANSQPRTPRPSSGIGTPIATYARKNGLRRSTVDSVNGSGLRNMTKKEIGVKILELYTNLLCHKGSFTEIHKFARTVTNKWLLYLLAEENPEVVVYGCKIIARLLVSHGANYTAKFTNKTGGFAIMAHRLKHWWDIPTLWPMCLSILFGYDVSQIDFDRSFDLLNLTELFGKSRVTYPDVLPVITTMLQHGLRDILKYQDDPDSPVGTEQSIGKHLATSEASSTRPRARSMNFIDELGARRTRGVDKDRVSSHAIVLQTVVRFFGDLHKRSADFREFALSSKYVRLLLSALYPVLVSTDPVTPETELNSRDSALTFEGGDVIIRPLAGSSSPAPIVRTSVVASVDGGPGRTKGSQLRRASSFVLITSQDSPQASKSTARLAHVMSPKQQMHTQMISNVVLDGLLGLVLDVFTDQVLVRKDFQGFGLYLKVPPGFQEHQAYFESYVLRHFVSHLSSAVQLNQGVLGETKVLSNMSRFALHMMDTVFEGWFLNGAETMLDFLGTTIEYLARPEVSSLKSVRLCSQHVTVLKSTFVKLVLLRLSDTDDVQVSEADNIAVLSNIFYWQLVLLDCLSMEDEFMKLIWYQLYGKLIDARERVRLAAAGILRIMLVQKPNECGRVFREFMTSEDYQLIKGFQKLTEVDDDTFLDWVNQHRPSLDALFLGAMSKSWEEYVSQENQRTLESARLRLARRKDILKDWRDELRSIENVLLRHEMANSAWMKSIFHTEHSKHQRLTQDQQDDFVFLVSSFGKMDRDLKRPGGVFADPSPFIKWKLDRTEGRNRMRLRLLPDYSKAQDEYQSKQTKKKYSENKTAEALPSISGLKLDTKLGPISSPGSASITAEGQADTTTMASEPAGMGQPSDSAVMPEDDFEMIEDMNEPGGDDAFEDKNRKVMRRLELGDTVQSVYNISRIIGLEACEGILIIGKEALYLMDNVFRSADGEIINVWQAPPEERDPYSQIITGSSKGSEKPKTSNRSEQESRSWRWHDVISISKRRFLFRDVAIEIFFTDGRSYLMTALTPAVRDEVFARLSNKTPHTSDPKSLPNPEDAWRLEAIKVFDESPQSFGSKFGSIFNASPWNPIMRRWQKGEISNFHYLMLVNTMAGRTFNDLTQYPVFPWVLADYTSEELDLNNPASFRDLSKPMGAQTVARQTDYMLRYSNLMEVGETPFHYGTHYSSAMVVASYLIRLPPFVQSYILLQGGSFDHPDRLFYSIEGAWKSSSRDTGTDVRELTPEFFYLPDFLTNLNGYDFGERQGNAGKVDHVILPPWAKGDPKIFIQKNREALESPYATQRLHHWIDLVFGFKQRGEAAVDNLNVFHHLSYHGAIDLDSLVDENERAITTNIIHNFGQTPHQVFSKPHPARDFVQTSQKRLDTGVQALTRITYPLLESHERVASIIYASKLDRLLCASPFRVNMPPHYDKFLEWGFADNSVRFFLSDNRKPIGLLENLHQGQISCVAFADSRTLITAGEDSVVSVYTVKTPSGRNVELVPRLSLFGHKTPVNVIAVSKAFSTFLTVSQDGTAFLWDLNRLEFIRKLPITRPVECARINDISGEIMLCSGPNVLLFTLNGELLLEQNVCGGEGQDDYVHSCAFYEGIGNEWLENFLLFTGHRRGRVKVWRRIVVPGPAKKGRGDEGSTHWSLELLRRLDHIDMKSETGANVDAPITCVTPMPGAVYTGDEDGRVYEWNLVQREQR
ncbi:beige/BEACH domain-containing protein [Coniella lustricola]|uniref:Beige protein homolog 1 n=1 Tax=Coniella lustricola TaxID=2025994 RepID=A0A2T2ZU66_9PEZI|nr:beige/BEACH domain-containing protein [Coniella lustricola]